MAARDIHPNETVRVRVVQPNGTGGCVGYETVRTGRTIGTRCVDVVDDFLSFDNLTGAWRPQSGFLVAASGGTFIPSSSGVNATERALGVVTFVTAVGAGNWASMSWPNNIKPGWARLRMFWRVAVPLLSSAAQEFSLVLGFHDNIQSGALAPTNYGAFFRYERATNGNVWAAVSKVGGTTVTQAGSVAVTEDVFQTLEIEVGEAGQWVKWYVDNQLIASDVRDFTGALFGVGALIRKTNGVDDRETHFDYFRFLATDGDER